MKLTRNTWHRAGKWIGISLIGLACAWLACAQTISTTTVQGTVYLANGAPGSGVLQLSWPAFTTAGGEAVAAGRTTAAIGADGFVSVNLVPNLGSTPAGLFYTAVYNMSDGTSSTEYWVVPAAAQATIAQVRAQVMPAAQAVQAVSKAYVDQAIQTATTSLSPSGGTLTSPLYLSGDPTQPLQAADKRYVDSSFAQALPLSGGAMTGPGNAAADPPGGPASRMQFATQHYVDTAQRYNVKDAGVAGDGQSATVTTSTANGITAVTCAACSFTAADAGKTINIPGVGATYLQGGTLGTATVTINTSGVVTAVSFSGYSGLPANATIPVTFSSAGSIPAVTAKGYVTTSSSGVPTMHIWVGGMDYSAAPTISAGWALDGTTVLPGAGLKTTIASVVDSTHITLAAAATTDAATGVKAYYGTDDTTALNTAMQIVLAQSIRWMNGGQQLFLPCGTYLISGALAVNNISATPTGFRIEGSSMGCVKLVQLADNTPILDFTQAGAWGFSVQHISFDYANYQPPNFTNSVSVFFDSPNGTSANFYTLNMNKLMFYGGYRGIGISTHSSGSQAVWGYTLDTITGASTMSGATLYLMSSPTVGNPRCALSNIYSTQTVGEPVVNVGASCDQIVAQNLEADNAFGEPFNFSGQSLTLLGVRCELCYRPTSSKLIEASSMDVFIRGVNDHLIPPYIGSGIAYSELDANVQPAILSGTVDFQQSSVTVDPCYNVSSGCTPPSHQAYFVFGAQSGPSTAKGNFIVTGTNETLANSGMYYPNTGALSFGAVTQQNLATSDGIYAVPQTSPYHADAARAVYQYLVLPGNLSNSNFGIVNGWPGAKVRLRLVQPPQGTGPYTVSSPTSILGMVPPPATNGYGGTGTGALCTATIAGGGVSAVSCTGGTGYPASTPIWLQFSGGTKSNSSNPYALPSAYITTDASGNLSGNATIVFAGMNYASAPTVGVGYAWVEQTFTFNESLQKWVAEGSAKLFDGITLTTQQAVAITAPAAPITNRMFDCGSSAYANLNACFDAAKTYVGNLNAGADKAVDIVIPQGTYSLSGPYTLVGGMHISGVMPRMIVPTTGDHNPTDNMQKNGGTWIDCGNAMCFTGTGVEGVRLENLGFTDFTTAMSFGGNNLEGIYDSTFRNLRFIGQPTINASDKAIELYNSAFVTIDHVQAAYVNTGLHFISQSTFVSPGNSVINDFFVFTYTKSAASGNNTPTKAGIVLEGADTGSGGNNLLYLTFIQPQVQSGSSDGTGYAFAVQGVSTALVANLIIVGADFTGAGASAFYADRLNNSVLSAAGNTGFTNGIILTTNDAGNQFMGSWGTITDPTPVNGNILWSKYVQGAPIFNNGLSTGNFSGSDLKLGNQTASDTIADFGSGTQHCYVVNEGAVGTRSAFRCANNIYLNPNDGSVQAQGVVATGTTSVSGCSLTSAKGGGFAGQFTSGTTGTCTVTITLPHYATNGNTCWANDLTTSSDKLAQTAGAAGTSATISGTTVSGDVINWGCIAF